MANNKGLKWQLPFLAFLIIGTVLILRKQAPFQQTKDWCSAQCTR